MMTALRCLQVKGGHSPGCEPLGPDDEVLIDGWIVGERLAERQMEARLGSILVV